MYTIAILGSTWAVWEEMISCLWEKKIPIKELRLFASPKSEGRIQKTPFGDISVQAVKETSFDNVDFALFSAGGDNSKLWAEIAMSKWAIVIDNSSAFRYEKDVPLVIPQINWHTIWQAKLIANPNCTTAIALMALWPIHQHFTIKKVIMSTYQATSGAWAQAMQELLDETRVVMDWWRAWNTHFAYPIPFNLIPHIDKFFENWYTKEEMKVTWETHKIFWDDSLKMSCTAVRIPTLRAHSESITLETEKKINPDEVRKILSQTKWVKLVDDTSKNLYPMPLTASGKRDVEVGRIRQNLVFGDYGLDLFVCGDQLLRGAALNAVEILEYIINHK